jgi:16S rRNA (cytosine1402-N4)-methyltransferase
MEANKQTVEHIPVLAGTLAEQINLPLDGVMVDTTIGYGGHSLLFGLSLGSEGAIVGFDVDEEALKAARIGLKGLKCKVILVNSNFSQVTERLGELGIDKVDFVLADLGISSGQLADFETGLSYRIDSPLDMRIDKRLKTTAADIVNNTDEKSLADLIYRFGQDRASRRIARYIVHQRQREPITTTSQLAAVICRALSRPSGRSRKRKHPATRTFQALRIAVNNELENLKELLDSAAELLKRGGYIAIISFHSLEDRLVKVSFKQNEDLGVYKVITKKPITATKEEIAANHRARSAKLRIAQKL